MGNTGTIIVNVRNPGWPPTDSSINTVRIIHAHACFLAVVLAVVLRNLIFLLLFILKGVGSKLKFTKSIDQPFDFLG